MFRCDPTYDQRNARPQDPQKPVVLYSAARDRLDDAEVRALLRSLRGDLLDLGCGDATYADVLARADLRYLGLDPDPAALARIAARLPDASAGSPRPRPAPACDPPLPTATPGDRDGSR